MSNETKPAAPDIPPELLPMISAMSGMLSAMELGRAHATFAASALQGLIIANVQPGAMLNGSQLVADAWRFADAMMQELHARAAQGAGASSLASVLAQGSA